ncbi:MAG TPA: hypothetical protein VMG40_03015 [Bryobacteraceae bacterium]|nr:hypothetical protein [Bryobacteraceae bacterium]
MRSGLPNPFEAKPFKRLHGAPAGYAARQLHASGFTNTGSAVKPNPLRSARIEMTPDRVLHLLLQLP